MPMQSHHKSHPYRRLAAMLVLSFVLMFALMYAMVDRLANVYSSLNETYMAGLMTAPMAVLELWLMAPMYPRRLLNLGLIAASVVVMLVCWLGIRQQVAVDDRSFLHAMIPHHAGALLMCGKAPLRDAEVRALCRQIMISQQREIDQMNDILKRMP